MKKYLILGLILLTTIISAKPTIGFIDIKSSLEEKASDISTFFPLRLELFLGEDYKIVTPKKVDLKKIFKTWCFGRFNM